MRMLHTIRTVILKVNPLPKSKKYSELNNK